MSSTSPRAAAARDLKNERSYPSGDETVNSAPVFRVGATSGVMPMVALWLVSVSSLYGQCETHKLSADDGSAGDYMGLSVAVSGDTVLIGAPKVD